METKIISETKTSKQKINEFKSIMHQGCFDMNLSYTMPFEQMEKTDITYVEEYSFDIYFDHYEDDNKIKIATGDFRIFNTARVLNDYVHPSVIFDSSYENCKVYTTFYEYDTCEIDQQLIKLNNWDDCFGSNIAFIDRMEIIPEFRGKLLGYFFLTNICNWLSTKVDLFLFKSFPLQFEGDVKDTNRNKIELRKAQRKLNDYYTSMGFKKVKFPEKEKGEEFLFSEESYFCHQMAKVLKGKYKL